MSNADRDTLLALAERVEGLHDPSDDTDAQIHQLATGNSGYIELMGRKGVSLDVLRYTSSLDAAKTLVPQGWHVGMLTECDEDDSPSCCLTQNEEPCLDAVGRGADMALSLVAASLRARAGGF